MDSIEQFFTNCLDCTVDASLNDLDGVRVSPHLFIDRRGIVTQFVPFHRRAWHAGVSSHRGRDGCNDFSIGIEMEGTDDLEYEEAQYVSLADCRGDVDATLLEVVARTASSGIRKSRRDARATPARRSTGHASIAMWCKRLEWPVSRIGVDLGGTKIEAILLNDDGTVEARERIATPKFDYEATVETVARLVEGLDRVAGQRCSVGAGTPGAVEPSTGLMKNCNSTWLNGQPLLADLERPSRRSRASGE